MFLDPRMGWTEKETDDARLRILSLWREQPDVRVTNTLMIRSGADWVPLDAASQLTLGGMELGMMFTVKPRKGDTQIFVEVTSVRFVDAAMIEMLLEGVSLYSTELTPLASPTDAADRFCIPSVQAEIFFSRVRARNGVIVEGVADLQGMHHNATVRLPQIAAEIEEACNASHQAIGRGPDPNGGPSVISVNASKVRQLAAQSAKIVSDMENELMALERNQSQAAYRDHAASYVQYAQRWLARVQQLKQQHTAFEAQLRAQIQAQVASELPDPRSPATALRHLLLPVVEYYLDQGTDARLTKEGMSIKVGDTTLLLADRPMIVAGDQQQAADQLAGRQTAARGPRQL